MGDPEGPPPYKTPTYGRSTSTPFTVYLRTIMRTLISPDLFTPRSRSTMGKFPQFVAFPVPSGMDVSGLSQQQMLVHPT
jgi:hypothetical protein